jgi:hypothetical protein
MSTRFGFAAPTSRKTSRAVEGIADAIVAVIEETFVLPVVLTMGRVRDDVVASAAVAKTSYCAVAYI